MLNLIKFSWCTTIWLVCFHWKKSHFVFNLWWKYKHKLKYPYKYCKMLLQTLTQGSIQVVLEFLCCVWKPSLGTCQTICFVFKVDGEKVHLNTSNIKYFLELNQVGLVQDEPHLWAHSDPVSRKKTSTDNKVHLTNNKIIIL